MSPSRRQRAKVEGATPIARAASLGLSNRSSRGTEIADQGQYEPVQRLERFERDR